MAKKEIKTKRLAIISAMVFFMLFTIRTRLD